MRRFLLLLGLAGASASSCVTTPNLPDTYEAMTWTFTSDYPHVVMLEFYSQHRDAAWPGDSRAWVLDDSDAHEYTLRCRTGEQICFGAWVRGNPDRYWGVGQADTEGCSDCCAICDTREVQPIRLE